MFPTCRLVLCLHAVLMLVANAAMNSAAIPTTMKPLFTVLRNHSGHAPLLHTVHAGGKRFHEVKFHNSKGDSKGDSLPIVHNSILLLPELVSDHEAQLLAKIADTSPRYIDNDGYFANMSRVRVCDMKLHGQQLVTQIIHRVLEFLVAVLPATTLKLFNDCTSNANLAAKQFTFSDDEPSVNIYTLGGEFGTHNDGHELTVNVHLDPPSSFTGGGTDFFAKPGEQGCADRPQSERRESTSQVWIQPPQGMVALFNGKLQHRGRVVQSGIRHILVASFTLKEPTVEGDGGVHAHYARQRAAEPLSKAQAEM